VAATTTTKKYMCGVRDFMSEQKAIGDKLKDAKIAEYKSKGIFEELKKIVLKFDADEKADLSKN